MSAPVTCDRLKALMNEMLVDPDGCELVRMPPEDRAGVFPHLNACDECQEFMDEEFDAAIQQADERRAEKVLQRLAELLGESFTSYSGPPSSPHDPYDGAPD